MVNLKNQLLLSKFDKKQHRELVQTPTVNPCLTAIPGTQEQVFCQVQKFPRIVVLPVGYGRLSVLELNPCVEVGPTNAPCGFNCCTQPPFVQEGNQIKLNKQTTSQPYDPNSRYPFVPPEEQIRCYNIAATLNQCDFNKRNFFPNSGRPESAMVGPFGPI